MVFIYGLVCPLAGVVRYVGKSVNPDSRKNAHIHGAVRGDYNHHTARWLRKLMSAGLEPELVILHRIVDGERWQDIERAFIASADQRGWRLTNSTAGGEGLDYIDPEAEALYRKNLSRSMKRLWNMPERREEARQRSLKAWTDPEVTKRRSASRKVTLGKPEVQARWAVANAASQARPEVKAKVAESVRRSWADPEARLAHEAAINREKMATSGRARWSDPEKRAALLAARSTPEARKKHMDSIIRRNTPEYRAQKAEETRRSWEKRRQTP